MADKNLEPEATVYVNLENGESQGSAYSYYVVPVEPRKRKQCGCGCCCLTGLLLFLLIFFLTPRSPSVWLKSIIFADDMSAVGNFGVQNNDYYKMEWSDADIEMYWVPYSDTAVLSTCVADVNKCDSGIYYVGMCAIKVGSFEKGDSFTTAAKETSTEEFQMVQKSSKELACTTNMIASSSNVGKGGARLVARGHISSKGQGNVSVRDSFYYLGN